MRVMPVVNERPVLLDIHIDRSEDIVQRQPMSALPMKGDANYEMEDFDEILDDSSLSDQPEQPTEEDEALLLPELLQTAASPQPTQSAPPLAVLMLHRPEELEVVPEPPSSPPSAGRIWLRSGAVLVLSFAAVAVPQYLYLRAAARAPVAVAAPPARPADPPPRAVVQTPSPAVAESPPPAQPRSASHRTRKVRPAPAPAPADAEQVLAPAPIDAEVAAQLADAQTLLVNGNYGQAISAASAVRSQAPERAWRIIGASACYMKNDSLIKDAYSQLSVDPRGQQYLLYVCQRNGIDLAGS